MRNQAPSCQARDITRQGFKLQARQDCLASFQRRLDARRFQRKRVYSGSSSSSTHPSASRARSTLTSCSVLLCRKCTSTVCAEVILCIELGRGSRSLSCFGSRLKEVKDKGLAIGRRDSRCLVASKNFVRGGRLVSYSLCGGGLRGVVLNRVHKQIVHNEVPQSRLVIAREVVIRWVPSFHRDEEGVSAHERPTRDALCLAR
jgi:hypothetical protein